MVKTLRCEPIATGRRRYPPDRERTLLDEVARPGASVSEIARRPRNAPWVMGRSRASKATRRWFPEAR